MRKRKHPRLLGPGRFAHRSSERGRSDDIAERLFADVRLPAPSPKPRPEQLRSILEALLGSLRPHPEAVAMLVTTEPGREHGPEAEAREDAIRRKTASLSGLPLRRYPTVVSSAGVLAACPSPDAHFSLGLDMLIAGVTAIADAGSPEANSA